MFATKDQPIVLSVAYFSASLNDLIALEKPHPKSISLAWLYAYCDKNKLCLLFPNYFTADSFFIVTLMKGLQAFVEVISPDAIQILNDLTENVTKNLLNLEPNVMSIPEMTKNILSHCFLVRVSGSTDEKIQDIPRRLLSIHSELCNLPMEQASIPASSPCK